MRCLVFTETRRASRVLWKFYRKRTSLSAPTTAVCASTYSLRRRKTRARARVPVLYRLYSIYTERMHGMHEYGMYAVAAHDGRRFDTTSLSRPPPLVCSTSYSTPPFPSGRDDGDDDDGDAPRLPPSGEFVTLVLLLLARSIPFILLLSPSPRPASI